MYLKTDRIVYRTVDKSVTCGELVKSFVSFLPCEVDDVWIGGWDAGQQDVSRIFGLSDRTLGFVWWNDQNLCYRVVHPVEIV